MERQNYELMPKGLLFFRDARPMDVDKGQKDVRNIGHGSNWPRPDHLFKGAIHALIGDRMASLAAIRETSPSGDTSYGQFGELRVFGPFPKKGDEVYLPRPLDWDMTPFACQDVADLPEPLKFGFLDNREGKKSYPAWVKFSDYKTYLAGGDHNLYVKKEKDEDEKEIEVVKFPYSDDELYVTETHIGNTLDPRTHASKRVNDQHRSGTYQGDYLRLKRGVTMWCAMTTGTMRSSREAAPGIPETFILGGQGGLVDRVASSFDLGTDLPMVEPVEGKLVRWTLLTPAYFSGNGWLPDWCNDTSGENNTLGTVMLRDDSTADLIGAQLVGACVGKPVVYSGWDTKDGVKPTQLAVPAGSVYLFRCNNAAAAKKLIQKLHLVPRSQNGNQGFGIGVCSLVDDPEISKTNNK